MMKMLPVFVASLLVLSACGSLHGNSTHPLILEDHDLAEKIWDVRSRQFIEKDSLIAVFQQSDYILLGETHDNRLHHEYQSWVIKNLHKLRKSAIVAFEMISNDQGELIKNKQYASSTELIDDLNQVKTTWNYKRQYNTVFDSVLDAGFSIMPANLDRATIMAIARKGKDNIPSDIKSYLDKNELTEEQKEALREEIKMSHCGMENPHMTSAMMLTQQVKDAVMANSLMRNAAVDKRVLVAGSGHVRKDRGVPMYIRGERNDARITAVAWLEVVEEFSDVSQYAERWGSNTMPFDYVWFTARVDRPDPCKSFHQHMKNRGKNKVIDK